MGRGSDWGLRWLQKLTFGADFLLEDGADVDGLRHSLERGGVVAAEEAAVVLLRETSAVEGPRVVAEALRGGGGTRAFHLQGRTSPCGLLFVDKMLNMTHLGNFSKLEKGIVTGEL